MGENRTHNYCGDRNGFHRINNVIEKYRFILYFYQNRKKTCSKIYDKHDDSNLHLVYFTLSYNSAYNTYLNNNVT